MRNFLRAGEAMRYIFLNMKRFDISPACGGVNRLFPMHRWGAGIATALHHGISLRTQAADAGRTGFSDYRFAAFLPEAHLVTAHTAIPAASPLGLGCQGVHHADTATGGNFGAFTSLRTANAARELGCSWVLVGHSEERRYKTELMTLAGATPEAATRAVDDLLAREVACARAAGLRVLFCIGETAEQVPRRSEVLSAQLDRGLAGIHSGSRSDGGEPSIILAYEPIWAIGPGKTPPSPGQIAEIAAGIKQKSGIPLVYGGGLKKENAAAIGAIPELDGGLIALTRFAGEIGFYPDEYFDIVDTYARGGQK